MAVTAWLAVDPVLVTILPARHECILVLIT